MVVGELIGINKDFIETLSANSPFKQKVIFKQLSSGDTITIPSKNSNIGICFGNIELGSEKSNSKFIFFAVDRRDNYNNILWDSNYMDHWEQSGKISFYRKGDGSLIITNKYNAEITVLVKFISISI